ncbi:unnamed protein product [Danaus chrysippus]|uniref:(African queen) hypothetical protein n=1 Tax=Danaus chrysippus TaxID=151541 RepID=A0A8J2VWP0_9NEOP|nr:unnamed protein product [Danaus chrysippus]
MVSGWKILMEPHRPRGRTEGTVRLLLTKNQPVCLICPCAGEVGIAEAFIATSPTGIDPPDGQAGPVTRS